MAGVIKRMKTRSPTAANASAWVKFFFSTALADGHMPPPPAALPVRSPPPPWPCQWAGRPHPPPPPGVHPGGPRRRHEPSDLTRHPPDSKGQRRQLLGEAPHKEAAERDQLGVHCGCHERQCRRHLRNRESRSRRCGGLGGDSGANAVPWLMRCFIAGWEARSVPSAGPRTSPRPIIKRSCGDSP